MTRETQIKRQFLERQAFLDAWGRFVVETVEQAARINIVNTVIFEVPPAHRVKEMASFMAKALSPKKNYSNPIVDIEDQVGARFVVLLMTQVRKICDIIEECRSWGWTKPRDFLAEREKEPLVFTYQSEHYIVRNQKSLMYKGVEIPAGTACEIQVRTLLQHAYSQLTHDLTYKPKQALTPAVHRCNAKSMALIEVADELFETAAKTNIIASQEIERILKTCRNLHQNMFGTSALCETRLESEILDAYSNLLVELDTNALETAIRSAAYRGWRDDNSDHFLAPYASTVALFALITDHTVAAQRNWPLDPGLLDTIVTSCGERRLY